LYGKHFNTLEKLRLWCSFESATPAVDHPDGEVDVIKVDKMVCFHFTITAWSTDAMLFSFIGFKQNNKALQKRKYLHGDLQYIQNNAGIQFPKGLT